MLKVSNIQFVYDQSDNIVGYRVAFDGNNQDIQMLSGSLELSPEDVDLSNIRDITQEKLAEVLQK